MKYYDILLDNIKIGTTRLEKADVPMGVVFGEIRLADGISGYDLFKTYCLTNRIEIINDYPHDRFIGTSNIPGIKVVDNNSAEIKGQVINIEGMDNNIFEVIISGIPYPLFEAEFLHHVKSYKNKFEDS
ncbi:hypothetical protein HDE69_002103 [Pedobacter cryoconitis]|uniref:Uncharacterized protein n=1 Tax=Pedobacter cryoconitis TaxID=188932 RepID=A0A7W8YSL1_9SPHI|nr:hypothetical protein [Pedobacter cryoconitis]MBB5621050.1 hypothetical protein [Pedobacter cryoconitis]